MHPGTGSPSLLGWICRAASLRNREISVHDSLVQKAPSLDVNLVILSLDAMQPADHPSIRGLPLPRLLVSLLEVGSWRHPGDAALAQVAPWLREPVDFLHTLAQMHRESGDSPLADDPGYAFFHMRRGSRHSTPVELPWLDVEQAVFIAVNREPGADLGIALDYRTNRDDPRVVASDWWSEPSSCIWRAIAPTFSTFASQIGLVVAPSRRRP